MVPSCPCLSLVTALSAAGTNPESHSASLLQEVARNVALGGRLDITCRKGRGDGAHSSSRMVVPV